MVRELKQNKTTFDPENFPFESHIEGKDSFKMIQFVVLSILALILVSFLYGKYIELQRDIHELALNQQSNITSSRKENETAIYRNIQNPHEMPLITGLQIRQGFRLRNGNIRDIWSVVMSQKSREGRFRFDDKVVDTDNLNGVFKRLHKFFEEKYAYKIGLCIPAQSYEAFVTSMACFINGLTVHTFDSPPRFQPDVDIMIISENQLKYIANWTFKLVIVVTESDRTFEEGVLNWRELGDLDSLRDDVYEYKYDPSYDQGTPLIDTYEFETTSYTHQNFVSSTASLVKGIPLGHELNANDKLLVTNGKSQINHWPKVFSILLFGGSVTFATSSKLDLSIKPTIITTEVSILKPVLYYQANWFHKLKISRALHLFSEGVFTESASLPQFKSVRLVYLDTTKERISSSDTTLLRVLTGSRIISERFVNGVLGAALSTNFYDYRVFSNKNLRNRGSSSQSLEIKLFRHKDLDIDKKHGELCIRGFIIGRPLEEQRLERAIDQGERVGSEGWMPTGIFGKFGVDGCFYED